MNSADFEIVQLHQLFLNFFYFDESYTNSNRLVHGA